MKRTVSAYLAAVSLLLVIAANAATRPRYGGTLRVETRATHWTLDANDLQPLSTDAALRGRFAQLMFDRLVRLDNANNAVPELAVSWKADPDFHRWQFELRNDVKLSDGSELSPKQVAASLTAANPAWRVRLLGNSVVVESDAPMRCLLAELALARNSIVVRGANNVLLGTGPFRLRDSQAGRKVTLEANDDYFLGRPFINAIELTLNRTLREQAIDLQSGNADVIEIAPEQIRRAVQEGQRVFTSAAVDLVALQFSSTASVREPRIRQAISQSIDRVALQSALLQKLGEASGALLPQWVSGYSFLFSPYDLAQARDAAGGLGYAPQITIAYDNSDTLARTIAERIALNARDVGLRVQTVGEPGASSTNADARIVHLTLPSSDAHTALLSIANALGSQEIARVLTADAGDREQNLFAAEQAMLQEYVFVPLLYLPQANALAPRVHNWSQPRLGDWPIDDVWLEGERP